MNLNPLFWVTAHHAMILSTFVALGRIFDHNSKHNIDTLMSMASKHLPAFSRAALAARKRAAGLTQKQAAEYVADAHELSRDDLKHLRKQIASWRRVYEERYRDVRHKIFAHKALSDASEVDQLLSKTNIPEIQRLFGFLSALHSALLQAFVNGRRPLLEIQDFVLRADDPPHRSALPGEKVYREGHAVLSSMLLKRDAAR
jgi:hypothetical protein